MKSAPAIWVGIVAVMFLLAMGVAARAEAQAPQPEHPLIAALHAVHKDPNGGPAFEEAMQRASKGDAVVLAKVQKAIATRNQPAMIEACAEVARRWIKVTKPLEERLEGIAILESLVSWGEKIGLKKRVLHDEAVALAQAVAKANPDDPRVHELLGTLLGSPPARALPALQALARCLELDPKSGRCRKPFDELAHWFLTPQCEGKDLRQVRIHTLSTEKGQRPIDVAIATVADGSVFPRGKCRGSALRIPPAVLEKSTSPHAHAGALGEEQLPVDLAVSVEGKDRVTVRTNPQLGTELLCVPLPVEELCKKTSKPTLPPNVARWLRGGTPE